MLVCVVFDARGEVPESLVERLFAISPLVEHAGDAAFLDVQGTSRLHGGVRGLFEALREALAPHRPRGMALAGNRFTAEVAARHGVRRPGGALTVAPGEEALFLSRLPLDVLPIPPALARRWAPLGLATLGDLASLPVASVESRYGQTGVRLHRLARGEDEAGLLPTSQEAALEVVRDLEHPLHTLELLRPALEDAVGRLCQSLADRGQGVVRLGLILDLDEALPEAGAEELEAPRRAHHSLSPASPEDRAPLLLDLLCRRLSERPPPRAVTRLRLCAEERCGLDTHQNALFGEVSRDAARRAEALTRLRTALGPEAVGRARLVADHRLEARWVRDDGPGDQDVVAPWPSTSGKPLRIEVRPLVLVPILSGGRLVGFRQGRRTWNLVRLSAPRRLEGGWWGDPWARDEYDAQTEEGAFLRVCRDMRTRRWLLLAERD